MFRVVIATVALVLVVAACTESDSGSAADPIPAATPWAGAPGDGTPVADVPVDEAVADFAAFVDVDLASVEVVVAEEVTWRDGSLGCPDPDTGYTQEMVEGYRIVLRAEGEWACYHGRQGMPAFHCHDPDPEETVDDGTEG